MMITSCFGLRDLKHIPSGFCMYIVSRFDLEDGKPEVFEPFVYNGPDALDVFYDKLIEMQQLVSARLGKNVCMYPLSREQQDNFDEATCCPYCSEEFSKTNYKSRHHNHESGQFISACYNSCNLQLKYSIEIS